MRYEIATFTDDGELREEFDDLTEAKYHYRVAVAAMVYASLDDGKRREIQLNDLERSELMAQHIQWGLG